MAGFAGYAIFFPGRCGRIIAGNMANKTSTRTTLGYPFFLKHRVGNCGAMRPAHPGGLEFSVTGCAVKVTLLSFWTVVILRLYYHQGDTACQQGKYQSYKQSFDT
jgi:hypothetical protein